MACVSVDARGLPHARKPTHQTNNVPPLPLPSLPSSSHNPTTKHLPSPQTPRCCRGPAPAAPRPPPRRGCWPQGRCPRLARPFAFPAAGRSLPLLLPLMLLPERLPGGFGDVVVVKCACDESSVPCLGRAVMRCSQSRVRSERRPINQQPRPLLP